MRFIWTASLLAGGLLGGCLADGRVGYSANVGYVAPAPVITVSAPQMYEIEPGIQVVSDYDYPVFYSDNLYWRYDGGVWYSSRWHDRGWETNYNIPDRVRRVDRPEAYVHYRGGARTEYTPGGQGYRGEPVVRDHRNDSPPPAATPVVRDHRNDAPPPAATPVVRDHRNDAPPPAEPRKRDHR